jgi:hypothetical protein
MLEAGRAIRQMQHVLRTMLYDTEKMSRTWDSGREEQGFRPFVSRTKPMLEQNVNCCGKRKAADV